MKKTKDFTFFWDGPFSNWHPCKIVIEEETRDIEFANSEQLFMFLKAQTFEDYESAELIIKTPSPKEAKALGRKIKGFDEEVWAEAGDMCMYYANLFKYTQNEYELVNLLATVGTELVEASPYDKIWGIGLGENDPRALDKSQWLGQNKLGIVLTNLRDQIIAESPTECVALVVSRYNEIV